MDAIKQTGETFHNESDEVVEQAHYRVNAFERIHGYLVSDRKMQTPNAAEKQQRMMEHLNSHHLSILRFSLLCIDAACCL